MSKAPQLPDALEQGFIAGAKARRKRAALLRERAADGVVAAAEKFPDVQIRSPEAVLAIKMAADWDAIAAELEGGAP
jgi:hypothetical protein